jgi:hypothetical protein
VIERAIITLSVTPSTIASTRANTATNNERLICAATPGARAAICWECLSA